MKTNLSILMSIVDEKERNFSSLACNLKDCTYNYFIQELDGTINLLEDFKEDFDKYFEEYRQTQKDITKLKSIIQAKNNEFKLSDGRSIQEAIIDNTNLRKMKTLYKSLLSMRNSKRRVSEEHDAYFSCKTINFDIREIEEIYNEISKKIQDTDFEISKLNSIEFEVDM